MIRLFIISYPSGNKNFLIQVDGINKYSVDMKKASLFIYSGFLESPQDNAIKILRKRISCLIKKDYGMFYIVMDKLRYEYVRMLTEFTAKGVVIVTKEFSGDDSGGLFLSLAPIVNPRDRILTICDAKNLGGDLLNIIDLLYPEFKYNIVFLGNREGVEEPVYVHLGRSKLVRKFSRKEETEHVFNGIMLLRGSLYKWMERRLYKRPNLANLDFTEVLNDYISSGGKIYGYIIR